MIKLFKLFILVDIIGPVSKSRHRRIFDVIVVINYRYVLSVFDTYTRTHSHKTYYMYFHFYDECWKRVYLDKRDMIAENN